MQILLTCAPCGTVGTLPAIPTDASCETPPQYGQLGRIIIAPCGVPDPIVLEASVAVLAAGVIDNANTDGTKAKAIIGQGGKGDHEAVIYEGAFRRRLISSRTFTIEFSFSVGTAGLYDFAQALQCNYTRFRFWFEDIGGWLYGPLVVGGSAGTGGLIPVFVDVQLAAPEGRDDLKVARLSIEFDANVDPGRYATPFALNAGCAAIGGEPPAEI